MNIDGIDHDDELPYLVLSIKQVHANRIFEGTKHFELRKALPLEPISDVFLYETGSVGIVGCFRVRRIIRDDTDSLWKQVGENATTRTRFFRYFKGHASGCAIEVEDPCRFRKPLRPDSLKQQVGTFSAPQSYLVVRPHTQLFRILRSAATAAKNGNEVVTLRGVSRREEDAYCELITAEISTRYAGITPDFARSNIDTHRARKDPKGFLTKKKEVLSVLSPKKELLGFTTLTYKSGGSVKTGPTVLFRGVRGHGYGSATRTAIENHVRKKRARKLYCTCPDSDPRVVQYLLKAGYRVEAHLDRHYHCDHGELVLGKLLSVRKREVSVDTDEWSKRKFRPVGLYSLGLQDCTGEIHALLKQLFPSLTVSSCRTILKRALEAKSELHDKPVTLVPCTGGGHVLALGVLIPKRGGAVKMLVTSQSRNADCLRELIEHCQDTAREMGARKLYSMNPLRQEVVTDLLVEMGMVPEGIIREPYSPGNDFLTLGMMYPSED